MRFLILAFILFLNIPSIQAEVTRYDEVSNALDALDRNIEKAFDSFERVDQSTKQEFSDRKMHSFDMGVESYFYQYWESIPIKVTGWMNGVYAEYTYRPPEGNILNNTILNAYKIELRYAAGSGRYKSGSGIIKDDKNYNYETRGLLAKDYLLESGMIATPYLGFGYRFLYNPGNGNLTSTGFYGYDRRSNYYYLPVGITIDVPHMTDAWSGMFNFEYDVFLRGYQISDLSAGNQFNHMGNDNIHNEQKDGFGVRTSFRFQYKTPRLNIYIEPFIRFWNIEDSDLVLGTVDGTTSYWLEPHNTTSEIGSKFGLQF